MEKIKTDKIETEYISTRQYQNYAKTLETKNINLYGISLSWVSIMNAAECIVEVRTDYLVAKSGWRQIMKAVSIPIRPISGGLKP